MEKKNPLLDQCIPQRSPQCQNRIFKQVFQTCTNETSIAFISLKAEINKICLIWKNSTLWFCYFKRCWNYAGETVLCIWKIFSEVLVLWGLLFSVRIFGPLTKNMHLSCLSSMSHCTISYSEAPAPGTHLLNWKPTTNYLKDDNHYYFFM